MVSPIASRSNSSNSLYTNLSGSEDESEEIFEEEEKAKGSPVLNVAATVAKVAYSYQRPSDENFLFSLTSDHQIRDAIIQLVPKLCAIVKILFPYYYQKIAGSDPAKVSAIVEDLALHVLANLGKALYGDSPAKIITKEIFFGRLGHFLISLAWKHLSEVEKKKELSKDAFKPLAQELLQIALPKNQEGWFSSLFAFGEKKIASGYLLNPLSDFLLYCYKKFILRAEESSSVNVLDKMEDLKEYFAVAKMGVAFLLQSFASHIIEEEDQFFGFKNPDDERVSTVINSLLLPFDDQISALVPDQYRVFLPESPTMRKLAVALTMKILGGVGRQYLDDCGDDMQSIELAELIEHITTELFNKTHKAYSKILAVLEKKYRPKTRYFKIFVQNVLEALMPEHKEFFPLLAKRFPEIEELICGISRDFILAIDVNDREAEIQKLRTLVWNKQEILTKHPTFEDDDLPDIPGKEASSQFGNERLVENILGFSSMLGDKSLSHVKEFFSNDVQLSEIVSKALPGLNDCGILSEMLAGFCQALLANENGAKAFLAYMQNWIGSIIFKGAVIFLSNTSDKKKVKAKYLLPFAIRKLVSVLGRHFSTIHQNISNSSDDDKHYQFFIPMVSEVIQLLFNHSGLKSEFKKILPLPDWFQPIAAQFLTTYLVPKLCHKCYQEMTVWHSLQKESRKTLIGLFGDKKSIEFCAVLSRFAPEFLAFFFRTSSKDLAAILVNHFKQYLTHTSEKELKRTTDLIAYAIEYIGIKEDSFSKLWEFITFFSNGVFLKVFADFFERIDDLEQLYLEDPNKCFEGSINIRLVLEFIEKATKHFQTVNQIKMSAGETRASRVPEQVMLNGFKASKTLPDFDDFFKDFASQALSFMDLDEEQELPLPSIGRSVIWKLFESELFPQILNALFTKLTSLPTIQKIVLSSLQRVNETINSIENQPKRRKKKNNNGAAKIPDDHLQRELIQMLADLVGTVVDLQPSPIAQVFLEYRSIRDAVGDAIAGSIRGQLEDFSTLDLCNQAIGSSITALHEGEWVEGSKPNVKDRFLPKKKNHKGKVTKGYDFQLPKTKAEVKEMGAKKKAENEKIAADVVKELSGMISTQTKLTVDAGLKGMWKKFQQFLDAEIEKNFDDFGVKVKHKLDQVMRAIFIILIYPVIKIILFPFVKLSLLFLDCYFHKQSKDRAIDLGISANKFLFAEVIDSAFDLLLQRKSVFTES